ADQSAHAIAHLRESRGCVNHCLLVAAEVVGEVRVLLKGLADSRDVAVTENSETAGKERKLGSVPLGILVFQKPYRGLRRRRSARGRQTASSKDARYRNVSVIGTKLKMRERLLPPSPPRGKTVRSRTSKPSALRGGRLARRNLHPGSARVCWSPCQTSPGHSGSRWDSRSSDD